MNSLALVLARNPQALAISNPLRGPPSLVFRRVLGTSALRGSAAKTPIQAWGWKYLLRQRELKRPIAPHLTVYQPQLTWMVSGLHRISGTVMGSAIAVFTIGLAVAPFDFGQLIDFIRGLDLPRPVVYAVKWLIAWALSFHAINGVRFLGFDLALGIDIKSVYMTGWTVVAISIVFATLMAARRSAIQSPEK